MMHSAVALLLALAVAALADPCVFQAGQVYTAQAALECWQTIPFNPAVADNTVDSLLKGMELYAFLVRASGSAAPCSPAHRAPVHRRRTLPWRRRSSLRTA